VPKQTSLPVDSLAVQHGAGYLSLFWSANSSKESRPLLSRAWVFQKRLLCPRTVYYGQNRILWECCEKLSDEFYGRFSHTPRSKEQFHAIFAGPDLNEGSDADVTFKRQWYLLIQDYRTKSLTFEMDRAIAFAGIARAIQTKTKFTYLEGVWKEFAELGHLWCINPLNQAEKFGKKWNEQIRIAPSWSWYSVPPLTLLATGQEVLDFQIYDNINMSMTHTLYRAQVTSFSHPKFVSDPESLLHDFEGPSIPLRTRQVPCVLEWEGASIRVSPLRRFASGEVT
jgi:hypothetical protein